jgi:hypothetical protein
MDDLEMGWTNYISLWEKLHKCPQRYSTEYVQIKPRVLKVENANKLMKER